MVTCHHSLKNKKCHTGSAAAVTATAASAGGGELENCFSNLLLYICWYICFEEEGLIWRIGNGDRVHVWEDKWLVLSKPLIISRDQTSRSGWNRDLVMTRPMRHLGYRSPLIIGQRRSMEFTLLQTPWKNARYWQSGAKLFGQGGMETDLAMLPPRIKMLLWRAGNNILLISNILVRHRISMPFSCCMCQDGDEINLRVALLLKFGTSWLSHLKSMKLKETLSLNG
ncbi:hypothetical protein EPI10_014454 [Gossypium australe]|uniref:Uncharacterized protein n=1 Tax=Gossypium australe TaxID=47621 RepID=A0A5B6VH73_9ROSI|nr:hypothetical protein EPI10_014454 [Gossypium australe]